MAYFPKTSPEKEKRDLMAKTINTLIMTLCKEPKDIDEQWIVKISGDIVDGIFNKYQDKYNSQDNYTPTNTNKDFLNI